MPSTRVLPGRLADTLVVYLGEQPRWQNPVYLALVALVLAALAALPVVRVNVGVQAAGLVRPVVDKREIRVPVSGKVDRIFVRENQPVRAGDPLARMEGAGTRGELEALRFRLRNMDAWAADLAALTGPDPRRARPTSSKYRVASGQMAAELEEVRIREQSYREIMERAEKLYQRGLAPVAEVEDARTRMHEMQATASTVTKRFRAHWQGELSQLELDRREAQTRLAQLERADSEHLVVSPVAGTVEQLTGVTQGGFLTGGERFAVISPSSSTVAEVYVSPHQVGTIRVGMPVRIQVDAFRYTDWGFVEGRVIDISDDFVQVGEMPVFRVRCSLDRDRLTLPNGAVGHLKKGMTLRAHFLLADRTLFQLLHDRVSDWVDPKMNR